MYQENTFWFRRLTLSLQLKPFNIQAITISIMLVLF